MNVYCHIEEGRVKIYRGNKLIGFVTAGVEDDPVITIFAEIDGNQVLTFNDLAIIQDNWDAMFAQRN